MKIEASAFVTNLANAQNLHRLVFAQLITFEGFIHRVQIKMNQHNKNLYFY